MANTDLNVHGARQNCENLTLSVITVSFNDLDRLQITMDSLMNVDSRVEHVLVVPTRDLKTRDFLKSRKLTSNSNQTVVLDGGHGVYDAMNLGISASSAKFICFWNSGDRLFDLNNLQDFLETLAFSSAPWLICEANLEWANCDEYNSKSMLKFLLGEPNTFISHQAVIIDRFMLKEIGLFNTRYKVAADTELLIRCNYKFGQPQLFNKVIVHVQAPEFASRNNRRSRFEIFVISLLRLKFHHKFIALYNLLCRELSVISKKYRGDK